MLGSDAEFPSAASTYSPDSIRWGVWVQRNDGSPVEYVCPDGGTQLTVGFINLKKFPCGITQFKAKPKAARDAQAISFAGETSRPHVWEAENLGVVRGVPPGGRSAVQSITSFGRGIAAMDKRCRLKVEFGYSFKRGRYASGEHALQREVARN